MSITIYDENVEWTTSSSAGSFNFSDNSNPHTGLIDLDVVHANPGDAGTFTAPSAINSSYMGSLSLWVSPVTWALAAVVSIQWEDSNGNALGNAVSLQNGSYGFSNTTTSYQNVVIPIGDFAIPAGSKVGKLAIAALPKTFMSFFVDTIVLNYQPCDPSTLASAAICFEQCIPDPAQVRSYLLCQYLTACRAPLAPTGLALSAGANNPSSSTITVTWSQPLQPGGPTVTGFVIKWGTASGNYNVGSATVNGSTFSYTITGLNSSTTYFIVVEALATSCPSGASNELQATTTASGACSQATTWAAQIVANGGSMPSNATLQAVCTYYNSLVSAGVDSLMIADILIPPDGGLIGSFTPFFHTLGNNPWTNHNFVAADLSASGLTGNGSSKYLDTGIVDNTAWASGTENGIAVYLTPQTNAGTVDTGSLDINTSNMSRMIANPFSSVIANIYDNDNMSSVSWPFAAFGNPHTGGFVAQVRQSGTRADIYAGNSVTAFASIANTVTQGAGRPLGFNQFVFAVNNDGSPSNYTVHQLQWVGFFRGAGMTLAKMTELFNAVQALQVAFGRAQ